RQVGLRRTAGDVRTGAAPALPLDHRDVRAVLALRLARAVACGRAGAEDDQVELLGCHANASFRAVDASTRPQRPGIPVSSMRSILSGRCGLIVRSPPSGSRPSIT